MTKYKSNTSSVPSQQRDKRGARILAFLRYSIDPKHFEAPAMSESDWYLLYQFAFEHTILGVVFEGMDRYPQEDSAPPRKIVTDWVLKMLKIERRNKLTNHSISEITKQMEDDGFKCCILKGQGNNLLYPNPYSRTPGDIDLWMVQAEDGKPNVRHTIQYVRKHNPKGKVIYHHIDYGVFNHIDVEVHYRPSFMNNPVYNHRLQKWFLEHIDAQFTNKMVLPENSGTIAVPTLEFNAVFQLVHIYSHLLNRGIGMRQIIDYYYVVTALKDKQHLASTLRYLGLEKIASAVMWVLGHILGMNECHYIVQPNELLGRMMAREILNGGNFGKYGKEGRHLQQLKGSSKWIFWFEKNLQRLKFDFQMVRFFPAECLCEPLFRIYHFFWRCAHIV